MSEKLPAVVSPDDTAAGQVAVLDQVHDPVPAGLVRDVGRDVGRARRALQRMPAADDAEAEVSVTTQARFTGETQAEVLRQAYEWTLRAEGVEIEAAAWARVPAADVGGGQDFRLTLTVRFPDRATGLTGERTHHVTER